MNVLLHQQVEGAEPGDTVTVDDERGQWLLDNGYASKPGDTTDKTTRTETVEQPNKSASKGDWVDYAVSQGMSRADAEAVTKDELIGRYGA